MLRITPMVPRRLNRTRPDTAPGFARLILQPGIVQTEATIGEGEAFRHKGGVEIGAVREAFTDDTLVAVDITLAAMHRIVADQGRKSLRRRVTAGPGCALRIETGLIGFRCIDPVQADAVLAQTDGIAIDDAHQAGQTRRERAAGATIRDDDRLDGRWPVFALPGSLIPESQRADQGDNYQRGQS